MTQAARIRLLTAEEHQAEDATSAAALGNDADPASLDGRLNGLARIDLDFPSFTDGRAYSQAYLLRRRLGFAGDLRATGEVLVDQVIQLERMGFSSAVLRDAADVADAQRQLTRFPAFYQGDVVSQESGAGQAQRQRG